MDENRLPITDTLAVERTRLANERTLLAYVRTFIILLSSGLAIVQLNFLHRINYLGIALLTIAPLVLTVGLVSFFHMRKKLKAFAGGISSNRP